MRARVGMETIKRALENSFDLHERHRELVRQSREAARDARAADEHVRNLRRLMSRESGRAA